MIGDASTQSKLFESGSLLQDLISFVDAGTNCRLMFVGDTAQLPPVKLTVSPALNSDLLAFDLNKDDDFSKALNSSNEKIDKNLTF